MINFTMFRNDKGTWAVLFPGKLEEMPGNNIHRNTHGRMPEC